MLYQIATFSSLLAASWFTASVEAKSLTPVRLSSRASDYIWTITWTGPSKCTSWPCSYSYQVSAPTHTTTQGSIPFFDASCEGIVDQPLQACSLLSVEGADSTLAVSGNFSTFETSGVGSGLIDIAVEWFDQTPRLNRTLTGVTPMQASTANHNTWTVDPAGCPVTDCAGATVTRSLKRGSLGIQI
ncbi:hypothetical protein NUW58_g2009 [Xylaria curta]|uniref:Uncharacterized protein n=1 Tax=Xylaria curta TaxID=42375 RepID=A0ACC1PHT8_9PEZI|nr:hypothetical protein NUW58_g2009 [Xylaria curta]